MPGRMGLSTVLMMSLLACGVVRGQQSVPWGPQMPPMPSVRVVAAGAALDSVGAQPPRAKSDGVATGPAWTVSLAAAETPVQPTPPPDTETPPSASDADLWQSDEFLDDAPLPRDDLGKGSLPQEAVMAPAPMIVPSQTPLPFSPAR